MGISERDNSFKARRGRSQSGQGLLEYILLLVVTIALILGASYQFNDAFRAWANNYFGEYLTCLLQTGELPAIGGTGGASSACNDVFKPFNLAEGRPFGGAGGGAGGGSGSGSDSKSKNGTGEEPSATAYVKQGGSGRYSGSSRFNDRFKSPNRRSGKNSQSSASQQRNVYTGSTEDSLPPGATSGRGGGGSSVRLRTGDDYYYSDLDKKNEKSERKTVTLSEQGRRPSRGQPLIVKRKPASAKSFMEKDEPMEFGDYLRYLLIAAIIIALVLVIGGQLVQISQELE